MLDGSVVVEVDEDLPRLVSVVLTLCDEDLSGQKPEDHGDRLGLLVVAWNGNVHVLEVRVGVGQSDHGDVHVAGFDDGLLVSEGIDDNHESRLLEVSGGLVGEHTRDPSGIRGRRGLSVRCELDDGSLSRRLGRDDQNVLRSVNTSNDSSGESDLVVSLFEIDDWSTSIASVAHVSLHALVNVHGTEVGLCQELKYLGVNESENVFFLSRQLCHAYPSRFDYYRDPLLIPRAPDLIKCTSSLHCSYC